MPRFKQSWLGLSALCALAFACVDGGGSITDSTSTTPFVPVDCGIDPVEVGGNIDADTVWACTTAPYLMTSDVYVQGGATLTINPGVTVLMRSEMALVVGQDASGGALMAVGTAERPIVFTSDQAVPEAGSWEGIIIDANTTSAVLDYVELEYGGDYTTNGSSTAEAALAIIGRAEITHVTVTDAAPYGIQFLNEGRATSFGDNTFARNGTADIHAPAAAIGALASTNTFDGTGLVDVVGGTVAESGVWADLGAPYRILGDVVVEGAASSADLVVSPGTVFRMAPEVAIVVGRGGPASFDATGTVDAPIVFTSEQAVPQPGDWEGIIIDGNAGPSTFEFVEVSYGGDYTTNGSATVEAGVGVIAGARATVRFSSFLFNDNSGIRFDGDGEAILFHDNTFLGNEADGIRAQANALGTLEGPNSFGAGEVVRVDGDVVDTSATWDALGAPYRVIADIYVESSTDPAVVTVSPGARFEMQPETAIVVGRNGAGGFVADAGGVTPIVFTAASPVPDPGDWESIILDRNTVTARFVNVEVSYGGDYTTNGSSTVEGALAAIDSEIEVRDSTFSSNQSAGLLLLGAAEADGFSDNTFTDNDRPIALPAASVGSLEGSHTFDAVDRVEVRGGTVEASGVWAALGAPYRVIGDVYVAGPLDPTITIAAGAELQFSPEIAMVVGRTDGGGLIADGSAGRITFTSDQAVPMAGDWEALIFDGNTLANSRLEDVDFSYCGNYTTNGSATIEGCIGVIGSSPSITDCTIDHSELHGVDLASGAAPSLSGISYSNIAGNNVD